MESSPRLRRTSRAEDRCPFPPSIITRSGHTAHVLLRSLSFFKGTFRLGSGVGNSLKSTCENFFHHGIVVYCGSVFDFESTV